MCVGKGGYILFEHPLTLFNHIWYNVVKDNKRRSLCEHKHPVM